MGKKKSVSQLLAILIKKYPDYTKDELYSLVICGEIRVNGSCLRNPKELIPINSDLEIRRKKFVSRGGLKLEKALDLWSIDCCDKFVLDAGSSTGGFTDCLLQSGAAYVHAVDVGYNQLAYKLRQHEKVHVMEKTNIMSIKELDPQPDFAVADLSFRSISGAASRICSLTKDNLLIALIKPQFEYTERKNFNGILKESSVIKEILIQVGTCLEEEECYIHEITESPIKGAKGNREFLCLIFQGKKGKDSWLSKVEQLGL